MTLELQKLPNQSLSVFSGGKVVEIELRLFRDQMFASVKLDGEYEVVSKRVVIGEDIVDHKYLSLRIGQLVMTSKYGKLPTDWRDFGDSVNLEFVPAAVES